MDIRVYIVTTEYKFMLFPSININIRNAVHNFDHTVPNRVVLLCLFGIGGNRHRLTPLP